MVVFGEERGREGELFCKEQKMDAMRQSRLQLTVPMPIKTGKVGLTVLFFWVGRSQTRKKGLTHPFEA